MVQSLFIAICGEPTRHRLVFRPNAGDDSIEEVVLHIQGILCVKDDCF